MKTYYFHVCISTKCPDYSTKPHFLETRCPDRPKKMDEKICE